MKKFSGSLFIGFLVLAQAAYAEEADQVVTITPGPFYIIAIVIGIIVSIILTRMAHANKKVEVSGVVAPRAYDRDLENTIEQQLASVAGLKDKSGEIARQLTAAVAQKVEHKVTEATAQMKSRYESVIAEKDKEHEITHLKYKNVVTEKNQTEAIVQSLAEGLVVVNSKGEVVMMNPAAEKLLGVTKQQKMGHQLTEDLKDEEIVSIVSDTAGKGEKVVELNTMQQETKKIIRSSSALVENENGQTVGMVSVLTDVTKQKELDRLKSQFVSTVTHELRTPIVATQKALEVIGDRSAGSLTEDQARFLDIAKRNLDRLGRLINDILDFSKLEAGKMKLEMVDAEIGRVVQDACEGLSSWANSKEIGLERKVEPGLPALHIDPNRIIQILNNLIGNALKFTPKGGRVIVEAKSTNGGTDVEVSVQDTGIGIAKEDLEKVFERFLQVGERRQTDISGTGLGLSIAKEIVELHAGAIWAESEKGQGARFIFTLPVKRKGI
jgi:PAS domain S-box-containing protein